MPNLFAPVVRLLVGATAALATLAPALAQTTPAKSPIPLASDAMPLDDYLALLARISPAAHDGANAFLAAHHQRCGRALTTLQLRQALAEGGGDPVLMAMIRASHLGDRKAVAELGGRIDCARRAP